MTGQGRGLAGIGVRASEIYYCTNRVRESKVFRPGRRGSG